MKVKELIKKLESMPQDKEITCQVVAENDDVWNCWFDIKDVEHSWMVNITVSHPELTHLPSLKDNILKISEVWKSSKISEGDKK